MYQGFDDRCEKRPDPELQIQSMTKAKLMKYLFTLAALAVPLALATQASAHATLAEAEVVQGQTARLTIRVPHGCDGEATLRVRVQIPEGLIAAQPMVKAGWTLETVTGPYENTYELWGNTVAEGVQEIVWTGELADAFYDEFVFRARVTDRVPAGETLFIPVVQECASGAARWIEIPGPGEDGGRLDSPAPSVMVLPAS